MVLAPPKLKLTPPKPYEVILGQPPAMWKPGVISLVDQTRVPLGAVVLAKNFMMSQDGIWSTRWGSILYGQPYNGPCTGICSFTKYTAGVPTRYYMIVDNGYLRIAKDGGAWSAPTAISSYQFNSTVLTRLLPFDDKVFIANGEDNFCYYDINSGSLVQATALSAPTGLANTLSNLTAGSFPLYYQVTALNDFGETIGSTVLTVNVNVARGNWQPPNPTSIGSTSPAVNLTWNQVAGAVGYKIYLSDGVSGVTYYLSSVGQPTSGTTAAYTDYGLDAVNDFIECPTFDTTGAPKFSWVEISSNRLWACGDPNNPNRVYWAATGQNAAAFSPYLGGGWVDVLPGAPQVPTSIVEFRNGQGSPLTTLFMAETSGYGSTYHVDLQSNQIGNTTIVVPVVMKAVDTFGTRSPYGVVVTNENLYFHSGTGGFFTNGSVPTLFNILATTEVSILVRPDVKQLYLQGLPGLCGIEFDRKIFWSVPYNNLTNNRIFVYDLNMQNWNPYAFDFGVKQFCRYTDNINNSTLDSLHLLAIPETGNQLIEIGPNFAGDNGKAFESVLQTGLHHVTPDHIQFAFTPYAYWDLGEASGDINMIMSGTPWNEDLQQLGNISDNIGLTGNDVGFSSYAFSTVPYSYASKGATATSTITTKERMRIFQLLNNWQMQLSHNSINAKVTVNQFMVKGNYVPVADPNAWIKN